MQIRFPPFNKLILFGGTPLIRRLAQRFSQAYEVHVWTAPRQVYDAFPDHTNKLMVQDYEVSVTPDINADFPIDLARDALGIGLGEAWRFGTKIREAFGDRLVDFMSIPYPSYLGGAHLTHAILRGERQWGACIQMVTANTIQGEVHDGDVIYSTSMSFPIGDEHHQLERDMLSFLVEFVNKAGADYLFKTGVTENTAHNPKFYLPRLNTERQGWVDFSWRRHDIWKFIRAFDTPYPGARTMVHDGNHSHVVTLHEPTDFGLSDSHPFQAGLITEIVRTTHGTRATVATCGGPLAVTVRDQISKDPQWLRPGMRLHTDRATLDKAMTYTPSYQPTGDVAKVAL